LYSACSITGPTVGVLVGGFMTTTCVGGYTNKKALTLCFFISLFACLSALPIPWINSLVGVVICLWLLLFFGGFIMPNLTGILLNSVPPKERAIANSVANFFYNLFGYLPAPFLYGLIVELTNKPDPDDPSVNVSRWGMFVLMYSSIIGVISLGMGLLLRRRSKDKGRKMLREQMEIKYKN
jgi:MFS family permease